MRARGRGIRFFIFFASIICILPETVLADQFAFDVVAQNGHVWLEIHRGTDVFSHDLVDGAVITETDDVVNWGWDCVNGYGDEFDGTYYSANITTIPSTITSDPDQNTLTIDSSVYITLECVANSIPTTYPLEVIYSPHGVVTSQDTSISDIACGDNQNVCSDDIPVSKNGFSIKSVPVDGYTALGFYNPTTQEMFTGDTYCPPGSNECSYTYELTNYPFGPTGGVTLDPLYQENEKKGSIALTMAAILAAQQEQLHREQKQD